MEEKRIYMIYRDGEIFNCYLDREYRNYHLIKLIEADKGQDHTWSATDYPVLERAK